MIIDGNNFKYSSLLGVGVNSISKPSLMAGFDAEFGKGNLSYISGFGMEFFGWKKYYQDFMPQLRMGVKYKNVMLMSSNNWYFKDVLLKEGWVKQPNPRVSLGIFYVIKDQR